jgi:hypothetical protein
MTMSSKTRRPRMDSASGSAIQPSSMSDFVIIAEEEM